MGKPDTFSQLLRVGMVCSLMVSPLALADGGGPLYGKFRPLTGEMEIPPAPRQAKRYSGEAGYYPPGASRGSIPPGYRYRGIENPDGDRFVMPPKWEGQPAVRFRPNNHRGKLPTYRGRRPYPALPGLGSEAKGTAPAESWDPGYRYRMPESGNRR